MTERELDKKDTVERFARYIDRRTHINGDEICLDDDITILAEDFLKEERIV